MQHFTTLRSNRCGAFRLLRPHARRCFRAGSRYAFRLPAGCMLADSRAVSVSPVSPCDRCNLTSNQVRPDVLSSNGPVWHPRASPKCSSAGTEWARRGAPALLALACHSCHLGTHNTTTPGRRRLTMLLTSACAPLEWSMKYRQTCRRARRNSSTSAGASR